MFQPVNTGGDPRNPGLACPVCLTWREPDQDYPDAPEHWVRWTLIIYGDRRPRRND